MRISDYPLPKVGDRLRFSSGNIAVVTKRTDKGFWLKYDSAVVPYPVLTHLLETTMFRWRDLYAFTRVSNIESLI